MIETFNRLDREARDAAMRTARAFRASGVLPSCIRQAVALARRCNRTIVLRTRLIRRFT